MHLKKKKKDPVGTCRTKFLGTADECFETVCTKGHKIRQLQPCKVFSFFLYFFFSSPPPPMPPHVLCGLRDPPSWAWQKCHRPLRLGRPWGTVTLSRCCASGDRGGCSTTRGLKPKFYWSPQTMVTTGIFPFKENSHGRAGNRTRDLMISSQRLPPLDHEAGRLM